MQFKIKTKMVEREITGFISTIISFFFLAEIKVVAIRNLVVLVFGLILATSPLTLMQKKRFESFDHF